ncbi:GH3 auxin-responsive promoter family protein [Faecalitalea cylindroides]|uniref:GH3 family domain-containing protein n=1 Tax=Faecalitalea cylindroides TaxID=39483 RepID=UPI00195E4E36|nr:GH3 auxin-responsive promoter family protein [Faecalitalea cylindroides]MBM6809695.1 GH3 auxin-responsive promoter family protein [Faecalitalea cylindroides]
MRFQDKLGIETKKSLWKEYCGFLDLSMTEYMNIQKRLLIEQISIWSKCDLGKSIIKDKQINSLEDFRRYVPLTTYEDYAPYLLSKQSSCLPDTPLMWIQTTWEGGIHPLKVAPYTKGMLETFQKNTMASFMLATGKGRYDYDIEIADSMLYALAPLPYASGLLPVLFQNEIDVQFLPPVDQAAKMTFKERNVLGFKMGLKQDINYLFGLGSVTYFVSKSFASLNQSSSSISLKDTMMSISPKIIMRYLVAKKKCKKENRNLIPKDLFHLKGMVVAGTDNACYKKDLEEMWGVYPVEIFAGTEPTLIGTETWERNGLYFFPDSCFYEFLPLNQRKEKNPITLLMDEVVQGETYEIVLTVLKGGAFCRYRVGDMYRCVSASNGKSGELPRFEYVDRVPEVIDIAGFTRITEKTIDNAIQLSKLPISYWVAKKEFNEENRPYMHVYVQLDKGSLANTAISKQVLHDCLTVYFKYMDSDYQDLKKILGIDPLLITVLPCGTFENYHRRYGPKLNKMNPDAAKIQALLACKESFYEWV